MPELLRGSVVVLSPPKLLEAHDRVAAAKERFSAASDGIRDAFYILDAVRGDRAATRDFVVVVVDSAAEKRTRRSREALDGARWSTLAPTSGTAFARMTEAMATRSAVEYVQPQGARTERSWNHGGSSRRAAVSP